VSAKRQTRELALQVLFLWDSNNNRSDELALQVVKDHAGDDQIAREAMDLAAKTWDARETIDPWIERLAPKWPPRRQPGVDRNIIRLAVHELTSGQTPPKVAIDEAIELAKTFSTEQSPAFVNGVLDAVMKETQMLTQNAGQDLGQNPNDESAKSE
jgi:N utilization substance protein B